MRKIVVSLLVLLIAAFGVNWMFKRNDPAKGEAKLIEIRMHMTMKQFIEQNHLKIAPWEPQSYSIDADNIDDSSPIMFDDHWIRLRVIDGAQSFELPPGRTLQITQRAGRIDGLAFRPFAQPKPLGEMRGYIEGLVQELEQKGWKP